MTLPITPPLAPMLARLSRELPGDGFLYEPKWDGFRCLAFCDHERVELRSRHDRPLTRYFPEIEQALRSQVQTGTVLDGELVATREGKLDFSALLSRLHPAASRVQRLRIESPAHYIAFDVLSVGGTDLRMKGFEERRRALRKALADAHPPLHVSPSTDELAVAQRWLAEQPGGGIDGVIAKRRMLTYQPGARAMVKVKRDQTADCVVAGFRLRADAAMVGSLLLGLYDDAEELRHVGVCSAFSQRRRRELLQELRPHVTDLRGHPWQRGFLLAGGPTGRLAGAAARWSAEEMELDWIPVSPRLVCEVAYDHVDVDRFRHPARFRRWRPDREPRSCRLRQLELPERDPLQVLGQA